MEEISDESIHLMVTSPPYFNAPFDYKGLFKSYDQYLGILNKVAREVFRVLKEGRIAVLNIDDMLAFCLIHILSNISFFRSSQLFFNYLIFTYNF
jgi:DNA modification methylase